MFYPLLSQERLSAKNTWNDLWNHSNLHQVEGKFALEPRPRSWHRPRNLWIFCRTRIYSLLRELRRQFSIGYDVPDHQAHDQQLKTHFKSSKKEEKKERDFFNLLRNKRTVLFLTCICKMHQLRAIG